MPRDRRPVIGLLLNSLFDGYEVTAWKGMVRAAEELDVDLLCFLGGTLEDGSRRTSLAEQAAPGCVDALVVLSAALGFLTGPAAVAALVSRLAPLPVVSVSEPLPGFTNVLADNEAGVAQLVEHLVVQHGRRRIAYLGGPAISTEAPIRYRAYRAALERHGIPFDAARVVDCDWSRASALAALQTLEERGVAVDAVLASNDLMALAVLDELRRRGVDVPGQIAVCGFDDIPDAASAAPPLTTVRQPLLEMAQEAIRRALALLGGAPVAAPVELPAELVVRRSCGCAGYTLLPAPAAAVAGAGCESIAGRLAAAFPGFGGRIGQAGWAQELGEALDEAGPAREQRFLAALDQLLSRGAEALPDASEWFRAVRLAIALARSEAPEDGARLAALSDAAHDLVASATAGARERALFRADEETRVLHRLVLPFPLPEDAFLRNLRSSLDLLGIRSFFLCRHPAGDLQQATLLFHRDLDGVVALDEGRTTFPAAQLLPGRFSGRRRRAHAVLPIQSPEGPIGYAVCEIGPLSGGGYEVLMHQTSTVLSMAGLMAQLRHQHHQLLEVARQAGMAEMAVGTLHNVGNLLNSVSVCAEQIVGSAGAPTLDGLRRAVQLLSEHREDLAGFFARDPRAALLTEYLDRIGAQLTAERTRVGHEAELLLDKVRLIRNTIHGLQDLARDGHSPALLERIEVRALVASVLQNQAALLSRLHVALEQDGGGDAPVVLGDRARLVHVLVNLVKNAAEAMRGCEGERTLHVAVSEVGEGRVRVTIRDSGEGIPPEDLGKIFSFGFTTKPDGNGFGLHTCALYAAQLGGTLTVESPGRGRGATFALELPREHGSGPGPST